MTHLVLHLDVELFISEVKKYPELWDLKSGYNKYFLHQDKQRAWEQVAGAVIENFNEYTKAERLEVYAKLNTRWRNLRDTYVRYLRKEKGSKGPYRYGKSLSFLDKRYKGSKPRRRISAEEPDITAEWLDEDSEQHLEFTEDTKEEALWPEEILSKKDRNNDMHFVEINSLQSTSVDDDRSFFESLLPAMRQLDLDQKLEFRSDVLKLVTRYRKQGNARSIDSE